MHVLIVLVPGFSHLSLGAILEPLRVLGDLQPDAQVSIEIGAIGDLAVPSSSGVPVTANLHFGECLKRLTQTARPDAMFFCAGLKTPYKAQGDIQKVLRAAHRAGVPIFGTGCAAWKLQRIDAYFAQPPEGLVQPIKATGAEYQQYENGSA